MKDLRKQPGFDTIAWICLFFLYAPIAVLIMFSFNDNRSVVQVDRVQPALVRGRVRE